MFRASSAHLQEDTVVYMQHMVLSLSTRVRGDLSVQSLSENWPSSLEVWRATGNSTLWKPSCWEYSTIVEQAMTHKGCSADWRKRRTTTTMVARTRLNVTLYLHCVSCFSIIIIKFSCLVFFIYWITLSLTRTAYHWWTARRALRAAFWETTLCKNLALTK